MENVFDLRQLLKMLRQDWLKILAVGVFFGLLFFSYAKFVIHPQYQATVSLLVNKKDDRQDTTSDQQQAAVAVISTYKDIISRPVVSDTVAKNLATGQSETSRYYPGLTGTDVAKMTTTESGGNSQVFSINVKSLNAQQAADVANETARVFQDKVVQLMDVKNVTVISKATVNQTPISPNVKTISLTGLAMGLVIGLVVCLARYLWHQELSDQSNLAANDSRVLPLSRQDSTQPATRLERYDR